MRGEHSHGKLLSNRDLKVVALEYFGYYRVSFFHSTNSEKYLIINCIIFISLVNIAKI